MVVIIVCFKPLSYMWDYSSAGEHLVDIEGVTSSILVSPTIHQKKDHNVRLSNAYTLFPPLLPSWAIPR